MEAFANIVKFLNIKMIFHCIRKCKFTFGSICFLIFGLQPKNEIYIKHISILALESKPNCLVFPILDLKYFDLHFVKLPFKLQNRITFNYYNG